MEAAEKAGVLIREVRIKADELLNAQALCLTNALMGLVPVQQYQSHVYKRENYSFIQQLQSLLQQGAVLNAD